MVAGIGVVPDLVVLWALALRLGLNELAVGQLPGFPSHRVELPPRLSADPQGNL